MPRSLREIRRSLMPAGSDEPMHILDEDWDLLQMPTVIPPLEEDPVFSRTMPTREPGSKTTPGEKLFLYKVEIINDDGTIQQAGGFSAFITLNEEVSVISRKGGKEIFERLTKICANALWQSLKENGYHAINDRRGNKILNEILETFGLPVIITEKQLCGDSIIEILQLKTAMRSIRKSTMQNPDKALSAIVVRIEELELLDDNIIPGIEI